MIRAAVAATGIQIGLMEDQLTLTVMEAMVSVLVSAMQISLQV
jgi:hypothetical protein